MRRKYQSLSTTCRIEYIDSESFSLDTFSDKQIVKNVKLYMLDVLKYNATYNYRLSLQYSDKKSFSRLMKIGEKCINDYLNFTKKLNAQTLFDKKGVL